MPVGRQIVLILSTDAAFAREVAAHWPADPNPPEFTVLGSPLGHDLSDQYDLAIADAPTPQAGSEFKQMLAATGRPAIIVYANGALGGNEIQKDMVEFERHKLEGGESGSPSTWASMAGLIGREILRRTLAEACAVDAETRLTTAHAEATLGRYMLEMRHDANNALTSVLGNAELLALEPGLPAKVLAEADTIRNMALRLHEMFQRFSSIEKELSVVARESGKKPAARAAHAG